MWLISKWDGVKGWRTGALLPFGQNYIFSGSCEADFGFCHLMTKWWVNEIKLRDITLNFNEKLCLPIFAESIAQNICKICGGFKYSLQRWYNKWKNYLRYFDVSLS